MRFHKLSSVVVSSLLLLGVGCGNAGDPVKASGSKGNKGPAVVIAAAGETIKAGTSKIAMTAEFAGGGQSFAMAGEGAFDYLGQAGHMTVKLSGDEIPDAFSGFEMRFLKTIIYMKFPAEFSTLVPGLKQWVRIDVQQMAKQQGLNLPGFNTFAGQDPASAIAFMRGAKSIEEVGSETIRGTQTTHFKMIVDMQKAIEALPGDQKAGLQEMLKKAGITEMPMEGWIDAEGRLRRMRFALDVAKLTAGAGTSGAPAEGAMTITVDLFDFGTSVDVKAPPAAEVSDFSELQKLSGGS